MKPFSTALIGSLVLAFLTGCISPELRTARIAMNERDYDRAMASADAELARIPGSPEPLYIKGHIYEIRGEWVEMAFWYDSCAKSSDKFTSTISAARNRLAKRFIARAYYTFSDTAWTKAHPEPDENILAARKDSLGGVALAYLDTAAIIECSMNIIYEQGCLIAYESKRFDDAIAWSQRVIAREKPGTPDLTAREIMVIAYQEKKDYPKIIHWAQELMSVADPETDTTNSYLKALDAIVQAQEETGDYEGASQSLKTALAKFPGRNDIKMNIALFELKMKKYDRAQEIYRDVLQSDPNNFDANLNLGTLLANAEKWQECIPFLLKALEQSPKNRTALTNLMAAYYNGGQEEKGFEIKKRLEAVSGGE